MANSVAVVYPVGAIYPSLHNKVDDGSLPLIYGKTYKRTTYARLWEYANSIEGYVKTDAEWLALYEISEGNVPYFSSGDGTDTFRVPCIKDFVQGSDGLDDVGVYSTDTQRNISGSFEALGWLNSIGTKGSFDSRVVYSDRTASWGDEFGTCHFELDAVTSVGAEHTGNFVKPKSIKVLWQIKAMGNNSSDSLAATIPNGAVISFAGSFDDNNNPIDQITNDPYTGWFLCDGTKGTPDLRGRFIIASGRNIAIGDVGGEETHMLTINEMPVHSHSAISNVCGEHTHSIYRAGNGGGSWDGSGLAGSSKNSYAGYVNSGSSGGHSHTINITNSGSGLPHNNMPPYYALAYIMKIQE